MNRLLILIIFIYYNAYIKLPRSKGNKYQEYHAELLQLFVLLFVK